MKSHTRLLVSLLLISTIANATGCSKINETNGKVTELNDFEYVEMVNPMDKKKLDIMPVLPNEENIVENIPKVEESYTEQTEVSSDSEKNIEELLKEYLYDENINYRLVIYNYLNDYENRDDIKDDYLRAIYMLLINTNVPMEIYLKELHVMVVMQQIPMCVPDDVWYSSFGNLIAVDKECLSLFDMFGEFAIFVHSLECMENHTLNEYNCYTCPNLEEEYTRKLTIKEI